jgi:hypothetical protein
MRRENVEIVQKANAAFNRRDLDRWIEFFDPASDSRRRLARSTTWYRLLRPMCPACPPLGTVGTLTDASTPIAARGRKVASSNLAAPDWPRARVRRAFCRFGFPDGVEPVHRELGIGALGL